MVPLAIIIAGAMIAGAVYFSLSKNNQGVDSQGEKKQAQAAQAPKVDISQVDIKNEPFIGNPKAKVTMAYWFDFQCPFCKRFENQTLPTLIDKYVKTGKLKIVFKDYQFLGPDSQDGGLVANAVWELYPKQYQAWQEAMMEAQDEENGGFGSLASILKLIREKLPNISADKVAAQVDKKKSVYQKELDEDRNEGTKFGIKGTPGFIVGTEIISGAQPIDTFTQAIDKQLNKN